MIIDSSVIAAIISAASMLLVVLITITNQNRNTAFSVFSASRLKAYTELETAIEALMPAVSAEQAGHFQNCVNAAAMLASTETIGKLSALSLLVNESATRGKEISPQLFQNLHAELLESLRRDLRTYPRFSKEYGLQTAVKRQMAKNKERKHNKRK